MKANISRSVEVCANIAIIIVAIAVVAVLARSYIFPPAALGPTQQKSAAGPAKGTKLEVSGVDWSQSGTTLVLALQKGCHFCTESAGFYQRIAQQASGQQGLRLVAVFPQSPEEGKNYLDSLKVPIGDIKQSNLAGLGVGGTPTLILVDSQGVVKESWVGHLPPEREAEVLRRLQPPQPG